MGLAGAPALAQAEAPVDDQDVLDILDALKPEAAPAQASPASDRAVSTMNPDLSFILDAAVAGFSQQPDQRGGHDPSKNGFNLQQLELGIRSVVDPFWRFDGNLVFSPYGVEIEEAYATSLALPHALQLRAGQFLTRFGRLNATHPHAWEFVDQPLVLGKFFGGEGNRGLGTEVSWLSSLPWYLEVVGSATDAGGSATARSFFGAQDLGVQGPLDLQLTGAIKQFFPLSEAWSLSWGLSGATGPNSSGRANRSDVLGTDLYLRYKPVEGGDPTVVTLTCEALSRRRQLPGAVLADAGGYASAFWRFSPSWAIAGRYEAVTGASSDPLDPEWTGTRQRASANLTYWTSEFTRIRLQGSADLRPWMSAPTYAAMLGIETVIGAHGAHPF